MSIKSHSSSSSGSSSIFKLNSSMEGNHFQIMSKAVGRYWNIPLRVQKSNILGESWFLKALNGIVALYLSVVSVPGVKKADCLLVMIWEVMPFRSFSIRITSLLTPDRLRKTHFWPVMIFYLLMILFQQVTQIGSKLMKKSFLFSRKNMKKIQLSLNELTIQYYGY